MADARTPSRLVFIGPPGAGKGTQAANLIRDRKVCHLSTGDLLRAAVAAGTPVGKQADAVMKRGELVSDEIMLDLVREEIAKPTCANGFILDGFPRTLVQATKLDEMLQKQKASIDQAIEFAVDDALLVERISGRRIHKASGRTYHVKFAPPKVADRDDVTGEPLIQRPDDNEEALRKRLSVYHSQTAPVVQYYRSRGLLTTVNANDPPNVVYAAIVGALRQGARPRI